MGKRNKEPQVGRRRPMIQLSGSSQKSGIGVVSRNVVKEEIKETKKPDVMDDQLAGFLAEINSLDDVASSSSSSNQEKVDPVINGPIAEGPKPFYDVETFDPSTQAHLLPENWSAIYDESTSYYYYWNTVTNEVQWYPPAPPSIDSPPPPPPPMEEEEPQKPLPDSEKEHPDTNGLHNDDILNPPAPNFDTKVAEDNLLSQKSPEPKDIINEEIPKKEEIKEIEINNIENTVSSQIGIISSIVDSYAETESDTNGHKDDNADKAEIDPYSVTEPIINKELIKEKETKEKTIEDSTVTEEKKVESENSFIDKDKELMSKIKEKIQRKKEEKLRKEKEESILKQKEESNQSAKSKEESLREKLIKKKIDREKGTPEESTITDELKIDTTTPSNVSTPNVDAFSVDIFAAEDAFKKKKGSSPAVTPTSVPIIVNVESIKAKIEEKKKAEKKDVPAKETPATKDNTMKQDISDENSGKEKGVWRIIDAGYDDDDDEDEESDNNETEEKKSKVTEKGKGEMDDYAEMLLEETIVEKDDKEKGKEKSRGKKKKSKRSFVPALPLEAPPPPPPEPTNPPLPPEDEPAPHPPPQAPMEEDGALQEQIKSLTSTLMEKFNVLGVSRSEIGKLQQCLIELEIRMQDWMAGVLESKYFLARLKEVDMEVLKQETAPAGWISHWSSTHSVPENILNDEEDLGDNEKY